MCCARRGPRRRGGGALPHAAAWKSKLLPFWEMENLEDYMGDSGTLPVSLLSISHEFT